MRYFLDSNIFIYTIQAHEEFGGDCKKIIEKIERGEIDAFTSSLNIAEVCEVINKYSTRKNAIKAGELISSLDIDILPVMKEHIFLAFDYFRKYNINFFDCIYLAVMEEHFIDTIITNDKDFNKIPEIKVIRPKSNKKVLNK